MTLRGQVCPCCGRRLPETAEEKVRRQVDTSRGPTACWPFMGRLNPLGYGLVDVYEQGAIRQYRAHRVMYELTNGPIPAGLVLLHACDNPRCCNPAHLTPGTHGDNIADMWAKGRQSKYDRQARGEGHAQARLTDTAVLEMRQRFVAGENATQLAKTYGITQAAAWNAIHGVTWTHVPGAVPKRGRGKGATAEHRQDGEHNPRAKLTAEDVRTIRLLAESGFPVTDIARRYRLTHPALGRIIRGERWGHVE